jgi:hypothetical protein
MDHHGIPQTHIYFTVQRMYNGQIYQQRRIVHQIAKQAYFRFVNSGFLNFLAKHCLLHITQTACPVDI